MTTPHEALQIANKVRHERAMTKRRIANGGGRRAFERTLLHPPPALALMPLEALLLAVPGIGKPRAAKVISDAQLPANTLTRPIGRLTPRQRVAIITALST